MKRESLGGALVWTPENLLILGAGFSLNAGLPVAKDFTESLLSKKRLKKGGPSRLQVDFLQHFVSEIFNEGEAANPEAWPDLEDVFTMVDLAANTGHNLGPDWSSSDLRVVRRAIIVRMIRMLSQRYRRAKKQSDFDWSHLDRLFSTFDCSTSAVLSMNWDGVFENEIALKQNLRRVDYGCDAIACRFINTSLVKRSAAKVEPLRILKPHGSVNWLYCDACRETFWVPANHYQIERVARTLFRQRDWEVIQKKIGKDSQVQVYDTACPRCEDAGTLGTRFATFSYRKALDFPMHAASWRMAERYLKEAVNWIFIGYSLPAADFEIKHLLKRVQLSENLRPNISLITGGNAGPDTIERFKKLFGDVPEEHIFCNGLDDDALEHLEALGVLT
ncbi:MAG: hypothetical protein RIM33_08610 [Alphaproteobacteria bacterium]